MARINDDVITEIIQKTDLVDLISEKEFDHRFYVNKKEHAVVASNPKKYKK